MIINVYGHHLNPDYIKRLSSTMCKNNTLIHFDNTNIIAKGKTPKEVAEEIANKTVAAYIDNSSKKD